MPFKFDAVARTTQPFEYQYTWKDTLLYALGRLTPEPTAAELALDSPYNTRKHAGLPPTPISNPGKEALAACINPPVTSYLFYFTDRQGTTHFETNQQDFDRDIQKYGVSGS